MRILDCSVVGGVAKVTNSDGSDVVIPDSVLMCSGALKSSGKLIISEDGAIYIADTQPDTLFLLKQIKKLNEQISKLSLVPVSRTPDQSPLSPDVTAEAALIKAELDTKELI